VGNSAVILRVTIPWTNFYTMTKFNFKKVNLFQYKLDSGILNYTVISDCINKFFNDVMNPLAKTQYVTFQLQYKLSDNTFRTLGYLNKINKNDLENLKINFSL
jgi:hypothetical protein